MKYIIQLYSYISNDKDIRIQFKLGSNAKKNHTCMSTQIS